MIVPLSILKKKHTYYGTHLNRTCSIEDCNEKQYEHLKIGQWSNFEIWQRDFSA